jgi:hypothetical protein
MFTHLKTETSQVLLDGQNKFSARINELALEGKLNPEEQKKALQLLEQLMTINAEVALFLSKFIEKQTTSIATRRSPEWLDPGNSQTPVTFLK